MSSISYRYSPPIAPPLSVPLGPNGLPIPEVEVVVVTAPRPPGADVVIVTGRPPPPPPFGPYAGRTGAQENFQRDMQFAMSSPEDRARMLGMNPNASADLDREESYGLLQNLGLEDNYSDVYQPIDNDLSLGNKILKARSALQYFLEPDPVNTRDPGIWKENAMWAGFTKLPQNWGAPANSRSGQGLVFIDPSNSGTSVRAMKGDPNAAFPAQRVDYVKVQVNGVSVLSDGSRTQGGGSLPEAHIPMSSWLTWSNWSTPR